ncbi:class I SAM-dependent methyltransferase [Dactylosporangium aurantiacum]|uniref:Class I SAM-dependent methyltransferase n=1 Tax=Dactylosporangium aurantiacum TaxID=35754 RepID=A0A9Q9IC15_9ACTN|nr:class I SAM-dependent methyltransferase [Dactylosporangium aurantiacum]MDG6105089.1 class I SAM-dependent methyltransferase [Dactylosporangium aurantiacum]UWZ51618.1 class I SAM-dependent methyltransferase [Dactylosporangium aurantiacum]
MSSVTPEWLALREPADAAARSVELVERLRARLVDRPELVIHDLGAGTGSMGRWLAPLLPGPQRWVLHDRDPALLQRAGETVQVRQGDITRLTRDDLDGAHLVTASALLDMFTADEVERVVAACVGVPTLFTISVTGRQELDPPDPLDAAVMAAFNAHQRRTTGGRTLLGPDAVGATVEAFGRHGVEVLVRPSPWRLGSEHAALTAEWLRGWLGAACEQEPDLIGPAQEYGRRRLAEAAAGRLGVVVHHDDLLAGGD